MNALMDPRQVRKEIALERARRIEQYLGEALLSARDGRITYDEERVEELLDTFEALAPMLRERQHEFEPQEYIAINGLLGTILRDRKSGKLRRKLILIFAMLDRFAVLYGMGKEFIGLDVRLPIDPEEESEEPKEP